MLIFPVENYVRRERLWIIWMIKSRLYQSMSVWKWFHHHHLPQQYPFHHLNALSHSYLTTQHNPYYHDFTLWILLHATTIINTHPIPFQLLCVHRKTPPQEHERIFFFSHFPLSHTILRKINKHKLWFHSRPSQSCGGNSNENA